MKKRILYMVSPSINWKTKLWIYILENIFLFEKFSFDEDHVSIAINKAIRDHDKDRIEDLRGNLIVEFTEAFYKNLDKRAWVRLEGLLEDYEIIMCRELQPPLIKTKHKMKEIYEQSRKYSVLFKRKILSDYAN